MDDISVKIQCLCNGVICHARNGKEVQEADKFAVTVLPHASVKNVKAFYETCIDSISSQYMCYAAHETVFRECLTKKHKDFPSYLVLCDPFFNRSNVLGIPCAQVYSANQVETAIECGARLILAMDHQRDVLVRAAPYPEIPVFCSVRGGSLREAPLCFDEGAVSPDGFVTNNVPDQEELSSLLERIVRRSDLLVDSTTINTTSSSLIGVLAHQGDFQFHQEQLVVAAQQRLGRRHAAAANESSVRIVLVRTANDIRQVDGLLLPGGWSNLQSTMMQMDGIFAKIQERAWNEGMPVCAVCAGMILSRSNDGQACSGRVALGLVPNMTIHNNILDGSLQVSRRLRNGTTVTERHYFSNGPYADNMSGDDEVEILATLCDGKHAGRAVAVRYKNVSAFAFHEGVHQDFLEECIQYSQQRHNDGRDTAGDEEK